MSLQYIVHAHYKGEIQSSDAVGIIFANTEICRLKISRNPNFNYLRSRLESKLQAGSISQIIYQNVIFFGNDNVKFVPLKVRDDDDVETMFANHEITGFDYIDLYIKFQIVEQENATIIPNENVEENDDEETEAQVDDLFTTLFETDAINEEEQQIPIEHVYCPPPHLTTLQLTEDQPSFAWPRNPRLLIEGDIAVGNQFKTKADCVRAISKYHMKQCIDFKDHRQLSSQIMCQHLMPLVDKDPSTKVSVCISEIVSEFKFTPSYKKTWIARNKAIEQVYGNWENSYNELPHYLLALKKFVPGTVVEMQTLPVYTDDGTVVNGKQIFHRLFWAFQPSIKGFAYCKPILQVDGTWLYGKYKGTLLMAVAQDGNSNIFPVAFALVEGETADGWGFFLKNLRMHVAPHPGLCLISDRHASIESAYNNPENGWHEPPSVHVYCIRHIAQNFMREIKDRTLRKKVINMGYALNQPTFHYYRNEIGMANGDALRWLDNIPLEKWTRAFDGGRRWGHMTTNLVESMNSVFKGTRNLPITALVRATYYRMGTLFAERGAKWSAVLSSGQTFTENCMKVMKEETAKSSTHHVRIFDYNHNTFSVKETMDHGEGKPMGDYKVNLRDLWCDCGKYQAYRVPCSHVIAACSVVRQDAYALLSNVYRVSNLFGVYSTSFPVLPLDDYWPSFEGDQICHNPLMRRNKKGRPVSSRIRTEMDKYDKLERKCALCRLPGHNRTNCPNVGTSNV
ncbi:uncharacterized protein LOC131614679 [Vicia villosa]|uniref:uncharacterized protein LOC131614679 n=1 Tax=Vicia villosa TaxID=3911 RepID=UPI00273C61B0|nr:uncharacterized protein LOC131614679 [Vicia villosa]